MTALPKAFDDADRYEREIRLLVPGYDVLHAAVPAVLTTALPKDRGRLLAVGSGPAQEAVAVARALEGCMIDALDPAPAMVAAARDVVQTAGLGGRVRVHASTLADFAIDQPYDAALVLLVGHLIADDGARAAFLRDVSRALRPGGIAILAELEDAGAARAFLTEAHLRCSRAAGVSEERLETMRDRLMRGFHAITRERLVALLTEVGIDVRAEFFRSFGVVGLVLERRGNDA